MGAGCAQANPCNSDSVSRRQNFSKLADGAEGDFDRNYWGKLCGGDALCVGLETA